MRIKHNLYLYSYTFINKPFLPMIPFKRKRLVVIIKDN